MIVRKTKQEECIEKFLFNWKYNKGLKYSLMKCLFKNWALVPSIEYFSASFQFYVH